jgi:hypothetical protein
VCEKAQRLDYYQNGADRLNSPQLPATAGLGDYRKLREKRNSQCIRAVPVPEQSQHVPAKLEKPAQSKLTGLGA